MYIYWINVFIFVIFLSSRVLASEIYECPIQSIVGQISQIDGPVNDVHLIRAGKQINAYAGQCLMYGDRIDAGSSAIVDVASIDSNLRIGRHQRSTTWTAPEGKQEPEPGYFGRIRKVWNELFKKSSYVSYYGAARGGSLSCADLDLSADQPLAPVNSLPNTAQKISVDTSKIVVPWKPGSGSGDVTVTLSRDAGKPFIKQRICRKSQCTMDIPEGAFKVGDFLILEVKDQNGSKLEWKISVVTPKELPQPPVPITTTWVLGVWRLIDMGPEYKLDAISRISTGVDNSFAAKIFLEGVFADEKL